MTKTAFPWVRRLQRCESGCVYGHDLASRRKPTRKEREWTYAEAVKEKDTEKEAEELLWGCSLLSSGLWNLTSGPPTSAFLLWAILHWASLKTNLHLHTCWGPVWLTPSSEHICSNVISSGFWLFIQIPNFLWPRHYPPPYFTTLEKQIFSLTDLEIQSTYTSSFPGVILQYFSYVFKTSWQQSWEGLLPDRTWGIRGEESRISSKFLP